MASSHAKNELTRHEAQNALLLGINLETDSKQSIRHFVKVAIQTFDFICAHIYQLETNNNKIKVIDHTTIVNGSERSEADTASLQYIITRSLSTPSCIVATENNAYFGFLLKACSTVVIFENSTEQGREKLENIFNKPVQKLESFCTLLSKNPEHKNSSQQDEENKLDQLTQLPDRREFKYTLLKILSTAIRQNYFGAVIYLNIDNFKFINNSIGHSTGDLVISEIAERLKKLCRAGDHIFRMGGDEFVFILNHLGDDIDSATITTQNITSRIMNRMREPVKMGAKDLHLTSSIGISVFPSLNPEDNDSEGILKQANMAMYNAKKRGKNCLTFFNQELQHTANEHFIIYNQLTTAMEKDEFSLVYQPLVDTEENIIGAEALIRWHNDELGNVPPDRFIHLTEESSLILEIGDWVIETACQFVKQIKSLNRDHDKFKYVSINVSPKQLSHPDFVNKVNKIIQKTGINPSDIRLEFTENLLSEDIEKTITNMKRLNDNNIEFLLDDFGTGYSSLSYLYKLPISAIKIDKSFVSS